MIYLDYAATAPAFPAVLEKMHQVARDYYANPSSLYQIGFESKRILHESRAALAASIHAESDEIVFTSGGTEGNNLAISGVFRSNRRGKHIVVGATEHHSVLVAARELEKNGATLTILPVDENGRYSPEDVLRAIRPDTALVSLHIANNETGVLQPIAEIGQITRERRIPLHCDAVAAYGHIPLDTRALKIDLLTASAHKMGGPLGVGFLFVRNEIALSPLLFGGLQERGLRPGTENLPAIAGFAKALELVSLPADGTPMRLLQERLSARLPGCRINGVCALRLPHICSITLPGVPSERLLPRLAQLGVYVSARAACAGGERTPSHVLTAMGLSAADAWSTLRFSSGFGTKLSEIEEAASAIDFVVKQQN